MVIINNNSVEDIIFVTGAFLCNVWSFLLIASPVATMLRIWITKNAEGYSPCPYLATLMNCMFWVFYPPYVPPSSTLIATINGIGIAAELFYLMMFLKYGNDEQRKKIGIWLCLELWTFLILCNLTVRFDTDVDRTKFVGICRVISGIVMYASPLSVVWDVIRTRSVQFMPALISLTYFVTAVVWLFYSLLKSDWLILIPNAVGVVLGVWQIVLYEIFMETTPPDDPLLNEPDPAPAQRG